MAGIQEGTSDLEVVESTKDDVDVLQTGKWLVNALAAKVEAQRQMLAKDDETIRLLFMGFVPVQKDQLSPVQSEGDKGGSIGDVGTVVKSPCIAAASAVPSSPLARTPRSPEALFDSGIVGGNKHAKSRVTREPLIPVRSRCMEPPTSPPSPVMLATSVEGKQRENARGAMPGETVHDSEAVSKVRPVDMAESHAPVPTPHTDRHSSQLQKPAAVVVSDFSKMSSIKGPIQAESSPVTESAAVLTDEREKKGLGKANTAEIGEGSFVATIAESGQDRVATNQILRRYLVDSGHITTRLDVAAPTWWPATVPWTSNLVNYKPADMSKIWEAIPTAKLAALSTTELAKEVAES